MWVVTYFVACPDQYERADEVNNHVNQKKGLFVMLRFNKFREVQLAVAVVSIAGLAAGCCSKSSTRSHSYYGHSQAPMAGSASMGAESSAGSGSSSGFASSEM